ncbi:11168_t:CDS:10 [Diversispora eburnea]|uniref:11168_t:CDS:1 n=1 Tax=Diversispora eburnea TaxID=1213867 RepID=A0A9N8Z364_9GLOM|nr:11168_t:CDS:10 [Diversispora eburnea]
MNANAPSFIPQNTQNISSAAASRIQITSSSGRGIGPMQTSYHPEPRRSGSKNNNSQGDSNARMSVNNGKRNNNPFHRKNYRQPHHQRRNQSELSITNNDSQPSSSSFTEDNKDNRPSMGDNKSSTRDNETSQSEEFSVINVVSNVNDLSLNDLDPALYGAPARRGQISLNHLLNFSFPPRQRYVANTPRRQRSINYQPFNKERFVNANFRFLVNSLGDYTVYQFDPDLLLQWENIEQVIITTPSTPSCPICLQQPIAARVTKCGHTFCLTCILHYLFLIDNEEKPNKKWRRCPICWDAVYAKDLKNVRFWSVRNMKIGDGGNSTLALPRSSTWPPRDGSSAFPSAPWYFSPDALVFSKITIASTDYMRTEYQKDLKELESAYHDAKNLDSTEEIPFIEMAIVNVKEHLEKLQRSLTVDVVEAERRARDFVKSSEMNSSTLDRSQSSFKDRPHIANIPQKNDPKSKNKSVQQQPVSSSSSSEGTYHFYQSDDGQHIYLHPLNIRILKQEFLAYEFFPNEISVKISGIEESTITEDLRKRFKYLSHLPLSCDVTFLEVDLKNIVSDSTLQSFSKELLQRDKRRKEKEKREKRVHEKSISKERQRNYQEGSIVDSDPFFYQVNSNVKVGSSNFSNNNNTLNASNSLNPSGDIENEGSSSSSSTSYDGPKTVWGTPAISFASVTSRGMNNEKIEHDEGWDNIPEEEVYVEYAIKVKKV